MVFDSSVAAGGVFLGLFNVASGGATFSFPAFPTATGVAIATGSSGGAYLYSTDHTPGYLQFIFPAIAAGLTVGLFAK